jgi:4a-hydroxytetrahydrobiopterin dehydratase
MSVFSAEILKEKLGSVPEWKLEGKEIVRHFEFPDFLFAMTFVNQVADKAEKAGHHPDIDIRYNKVRLALISHDKGGLTERDFKMAREIDSIPEQLSKKESR